MPRGTCAAFISLPLMDKVEIRPTILEVPKPQIDKVLQEIEPLIASVHIDVEDGVFVPRVNDFSHHFVQGLKSKFKFLIDAHLMVKDPLSLVEDYIKVGTEIISFHYESSNHPQDVIERVKDLGAKACLALKLETDVYLSRPFWDDLEEILLMSVNPGWGGQEFDERVLDRIEQLRELGWKGKIKIDGGVNSAVGKKAVEKGADILVAGTALFSHGNIEVNYKKLIDSI
jgi:ribulose-phosphate 3-epimerase